MADITKNINNVRYTTLLRHGVSGPGVLRVKRRLLKLGYYDSGITKITSSRFGSDTVAAVKLFQSQNELTADGLVGPLTWEALFDEEAEPAVTQEPLSASKGILQTILEKLESCIKNGDIYVWGARGQDGLTEAWIRARETTVEWADKAVRLWRKMLAAGHKNPRAFDCSGLISWLFIAVGILDKRRDCDGLWARCTPIDKPRNGALLFRVNASNAEDETHVGIYFNGYQYHAKGRDYGVVKEKYDASYWKKIGWYNKMPEK